jgi:hypothetical protein
MNTLVQRTAIAAAAILSGYLIWIWAWPDSIFLLCFDDSFYYFEIARNLAAGEGSTFDRIHLTNGYHYLWMALCVPFYQLGLSGVTAVQSLLTLQVLIHGVAIGVFASAISTAIGPWPLVLEATPDRQALGRRITSGLAILFAIAATSPMLFKMIVNGMESGIYVLFYAILLARSVVHRGDFVTNTSHQERWLLAIVASLAFLSRTDAGLMLLCLGISSLPAAWRLGMPGWGRLVELFGLPAATIAGFLIFNELYFGIPMQVSGELKRVAPDALRGTILVVALLAPFLVALMLRGEVGRKFPRVRALLVSTAWFGVFVALLFAYYLGLQTFARAWYFGPAALYGLMLAIVAVADLCEGVILEAKPNARRPERQAMVVLALAGFLGIGGWLAQGYYLNSSGLLDMRLANRAAAEWINQNLPESTVLGSWDAGVLGYFTEQRVVNLDGVVNGVEYLEAMKRSSKTGRPETAPLVAAAGVTFVVNHMNTSEGEPENFAEKASQFLGKTTTETWQLVEEWPFVFSGGTNDDLPGKRPMAVRLLRLTNTPGLEPVASPDDAAASAHDSPPP